MKDRKQKSKRAGIKKARHPGKQKKSPGYFPEDPKGKQRKEGEAKQSRKSKAKGKEAAEKQNGKRKTHRRKPSGVPWHTMCPVIFAPTVPAPGRFSFSLLNAARGALALSWISRFPLHHSACGDLPLSWHFRFSLFHSVRSVFLFPFSGISVFHSAFFRPPRHRPDSCLTRIGISPCRCKCTAAFRCADIRVSAFRYALIRVSASRYVICCSAAAPGKSN